MDNEIILIDRLDLIRQVIKKQGEENFYLAFSGGKDSTVLHYLIDEAIPNNNIPRVYINTGIEYVDIVKFVKTLKENDNRIVIINNELNIKKTLEQYGYPFKSKNHSKKVRQYQESGLTKALIYYIKGLNKYGNKTIFECPKILKYQFSEKCNIKISEKCCDLFKKQNFNIYENESKRKVPINGVRMDEGGNRKKNHECVIFDDKKNVKLFKPLNPVTNDWMDWYINQRDIKLCKLYYPPYNFKRTGCKGCPFSLNLQIDLDTMQNLLPSERKQCEYIWKEVYDEYRRIGYRLKNIDQKTLF